MAAAGLVAAGRVAQTPVEAQEALVGLPAQGSVYVLVGEGGNSAVQIGPEGPLVVDPQPAAMSERVLESVRALSPRPIRHVVLTSGGEQQTGGAASLAKAAQNPVAVVTWPNASSPRKTKSTDCSRRSGSTSRTTRCGRGRGS